MSRSRTVPLHLGLILDGNRRWAKANNLSQLEGHKKGYENLKTIGLAAVEAGVRYVSVFVFSTENWNRSKREVDYLMKLLYRVATDDLEEFHEKNIRVRFAGRKDKLNKKIIQAIEKVEAKTKQNNGGELILCLNYGGQQEIVDATKRLINSKVKASHVSQSVFEKYLYVADVPPIDLVVRTSGEQRLSNFMLWRTAYSELIFTDKQWPDFNEGDLQKSLMEFGRRRRRFGG